MEWGKGKGRENNDYIVYFLKKRGENEGKNEGAGGVARPTHNLCALAAIPPRRPSPNQLSARVRHPLSAQSMQSMLVLPRASQHQLAALWVAAAAITTSISITLAGASDRRWGPLGDPARRPVRGARAACRPPVRRIMRGARARC